MLSESSKSNRPSTPYYRLISFCLLFIALFASSGCLQTGYDLQNRYLDGIDRIDTSAGELLSDLSSKPESFDAPYDMTYKISYDLEKQIKIELNFDSVLRQNLFQTQGNLTIQSETALPYILLNSTLWKDGRLVEKARYMMIEVYPGRTYEFDICHSRVPTSENSPRLSPGDDYLCVLEVQSPGGWHVSESKECLVIQEMPSESSPVTTSEYDARYLKDNLYDLDSNPISGIERSSYDHGYLSATLPPSEVERYSYDAASSYGAPSSYGVSETSTTSRIEYEVEKSAAPPLSQSSSYQRDTSDSVVETAYGRDDATENENRQNAGYSSPDTTQKQNPETSAAGKRDDFVTKGVIYVGSLSSDKYHISDCRYAQKIKPENRIIFKDVWEAREMGYVPCKVCNPS